MIKELLTNLLTKPVTKNYHGRKDFRPTVVCAVQDKNGRFLLGEHPKSKSWFFIQGGINPEESLTEAFDRELREEVGLTRVKFTGHLQTTEIHYLPNRPVRDGFAKGKVYFVCTGETGETDLTIDETELSNARWLDSQEIINLCNSSMEPEKANLVYAVLPRSANGGKSCH